MAIITVPAEGISIEDWGKEKEQQEKRKKQFQLRRAEEIKTALDTGISIGDYFTEKIKALPVGGNLYILFSEWTMKTYIPQYYYYRFNKKESKGTIRCKRYDDGYLILKLKETPITATAKAPAKKSAPTKKGVKKKSIATKK